MIIRQSPSNFGPVSVALITLFLSGTVLAQQRSLTVEAIYDPDQRVNFNGRIPSGLTWLDDRHYLERERSTQGGRFRLLSYRRVA